MSEFLTFDGGDILISDITGESPRAGRARELTRFGTLNMYFPYAGNIGLFPRIDVTNNSISTTALFPVPKDTCYFVGVVQSVVAPSLDGKMERTFRLPGTNKLKTEFWKADALQPLEILLAFTQNMHPAMPAQPPEGFYWGRVQAERRNGSQVIQPAMLDRSPVPESAKRLSSDEIRAVFKKAAPDTDPKSEAAPTAPVAVVAAGEPGKAAPVANWKMRIQAEATALYLRLRKSGANPTRHSLIKPMATWCRDNDIKTDGKIFPSEGYLKTHVLGGKHWDVPN